MTYEEYYKTIINYFHDSIFTKEEKLHNKIFITLLNWYKNNYEEKLKECFKLQKEREIISISKQIKQVCSLSDYEKIQNTYECESLVKLNELSEKIYLLAIEMSKNNQIAFNKQDYDNLINELNKIESNFPKIIEDKLKMIKSECLLDLDYLLNHGKVSVYSFRLYDYLRDKI